jgi:hypothetical protein
LCVIFFSRADDNDHGGHRGYTTWALAHWWRVVASHEATDALHQAMFIALYRPIGMVIKIAVKIVIFSFIVDNSVARIKIFLIFTI